MAQTSRYVSFLEDAYLRFAVPRFSPSVRRRVVAPAKYSAVDTGLSRANSPQPQPDVGRRLETAVALHLKRRASSTSRAPLSYADERDRWECDFITPDEAVQVCFEVDAANRARKLSGALEGARLPGRRRPRVVTFDQTGRLREDGTEIDIVPAWRWMTVS